MKRLVLQEVQGEPCTYNCGDDDCGLFVTSQTVLDPEQVVWTVDPEMDYEITVEAVLVRMGES